MGSFGVRSGVRSAIVQGRSGFVQELFACSSEVVRQSFVDRSKAFRKNFLKKFPKVFQKVLTIISANYEETPLMNDQKIHYTNGALL